ncbi:uncharacterized protein B0H18DRAFT_1154924 [Fomitopsis serialis]|uniref:uncharacterized protein n=1 Tax=Fomitopsis serialis TaxID=139415 RepID=UPI002008308F|nr:uncharacterized protein B0H18DRAFT_1154924 [Neoantrodia serialis]KAH9912868.1 hypothetical protein B0H18DRAFT_1154924 [Neoantrodia serialis]
MSSRFRLGGGRSAARPLILSVMRVALSTGVTIPPNHLSQNLTRWYPRRVACIVPYRGPSLEVVHHLRNTLTSSALPGLTCGCCRPTYHGRVHLSQRSKRMHPLSVIVQPKNARHQLTTEDASSNGHSSSNSRLALEPLREYSIQDWLSTTRTHTELPTLRRYRL